MPPHERSRRRHGSIDPRNLQDLENPETSPGDVPARIGWTKHQLMSAGDLSGKGFDTLRKAARVKGPTHGGLRHIFSAEDLFALIQKGESGKYNIQGGPAAKAWRVFLAEAGIAMPEVISRAKKR
jgi:hypothetical protein